MRLYQRGMIKAKLRDQDSAIADYTAVIDMLDAPDDIRAMARYNRSIAYTASHHHTEAIDDLQQLLEMKSAATNVRTAARRQFVRIQRSSDRLDEHAASSAS